MQMVIGCGRGIPGMAKNHIKTNIIGWQCVVNCFETQCYNWDHKNSGPDRSWSLVLVHTLSTAAAPGPQRGTPWLKR